MEIHCPKDLNQFMVNGVPFENTFADDECEKKKFYGDCFHCFATAITKHDTQVYNKGVDDSNNTSPKLDEIYDEIKSEIVPSDGTYNYDTSNIGLRKALKIMDKYHLTRDQQRERRLWKN